MITPILAYFAGIIDADGCISIHKNTSYGVSPYYSLRVTVAMTRNEAIELLGEIYGGSLTLRELKSSKIEYRWVIVSQQARKFLEDIYEFLRVKKDQAKVGIELEMRRKLAANYKSGSRAKYVLPKEELDIREKMFQEIKELKR